MKTKSQEIKSKDLIAAENKKNPVIDQFIIEAYLIYPVSKIVNQIKSREFRDCDINWLDAKLENFTKFACKTLAISLPTAIDFEKEGVTLNDYVLNQYLKRFSILLEYFKTV